MALVTVVAGCGGVQVQVMRSPRAAIRRIAVLPIMVDRFDPQRASHRLSTGELETRLVSDGVRDSGVELIDAYAWFSAPGSADAVTLRGTVQRALVDEWVGGQTMGSLHSGGTHFHYIQYRVALALHDADGMQLASARSETADANQLDELVHATARRLLEKMPLERRVVAGLR